MHKGNDMNIYMVLEDGEHNCYKAESMQSAIDIAENLYVEEMRQHAADNGLDFSEAEERTVFRRDAIESCQLMGELKN